MTQQGESQNDPQLRNIELSGSDREMQSRQLPNVYTQKGGGTYNPQVQGSKKIAINKGGLSMGSVSESKEKRPQQGESQNNPPPKDVKRSGSDSKEDSQQPHNAYKQIGGGEYNPQMQGVETIDIQEGGFKMGERSATTTYNLHFDVKGVGPIKYP